MKLYDALTSNPLVPRIFALERKGLHFDVETMDVYQSLDNRKPAFLKINPEGQVPALVLDDGTVLTEVTAICEYFDEIAKGGTSLIGATPEERAETRMWLRRVDLEICQPTISWYRNDPDTIDFYKGNRIPIPEARMVEKIRINQALNLLDAQLEGKTWLCGDRFTVADIHFYALLQQMVAAGVCSWIINPGRRNFVAYWNRLAQRPAFQEGLKGFPARVDL